MSPLFRYLIPKSVTLTLNKISEHCKDLLSTPAHKLKNNLERNPLQTIGENVTFLIFRLNLLDIYVTKVYIFCLNQCYLNAMKSMVVLNIGLVYTLIDTYIYSKTV